MKIIKRLPLFLFSIFTSISFSQNITEKISFLNTHMKANFSQEKPALKLVYGPYNFSINNAYLISEDSLLCFDQNLATLYLVNLKNNLILSKLPFYSFLNSSYKCNF